MLVCIGEEKDARLWVAIVVLMLSIVFSERNKRQEYLFLRYMNVVRPMDKGEETSGCDCLRWSTYEEKNHSLR